MKNIKNGIVIANFANKVLIYSTDYGYIDCFFRKNLPTLVAGDKVFWITSENGKEHVITSLEPRQSVVARMNNSKVMKNMAANVTKIIIVCAYKPDFKTQLLDRYLVNCAFLQITPVIVYNKIDLLSPSELAKVKDKLKYYAQLGLELIYLSTKDNTSMQELKKLIAGHTVVFMGQSGVGKSSLVNKLIPQANAKVGETTKWSKGKHTTTTATLYFADNDTKIIDSPGIRDLVLEHLSAADISNGFSEFAAFVQNCRFRNCRHRKEPGCAVRNAVESGAISAARYLSYENMLSGK